ASSRHRPQVAPGLDRRPAAAARPRRAALTLPEEIRRAGPQEIARPPAPTAKPPHARGFLIRAMPSEHLPVASTLSFVVAGHSRPKDGVASLRLCPGHVA